MTFPRQDHKQLYRKGSRGIRDIAGPLLFVENMTGVGYGELVTVESGADARLGRVIQFKDDLCVVQIFDDTVGLEAGRTVWMEHDVAKVGVGEALRGRVLNGRGQPVGGKKLYGVKEFLPVDGSPINPADRTTPNGVIETGISALDLMNTLARGQKLPVFAGPGLPACEIAARIAAGATIPGKDDEFLVVFAAIGVTGREADLLMEAFERDGAADGGVFVLNTAGDPLAERLLTPRVALTIAEYFAFVRGYDVLVVMADMLHYCEALREIGTARGDIAGRGGYPVGMYSDLAQIYERSGCVAGRPGSVTQLPVVTMPNDDIAHPVADLTGQITDGQLVLDRRLHAKGVFPPLDVTASLSRPMNKGIGRGKTFDSHRVLAEQLYAAYAKARELSFDLGFNLGFNSRFDPRSFAPEGGLSDLEKRCLRFGDVFEASFVDQGRGRRFARRTLAQSEAKAWEALSELPIEELSRLPRKLLERKISVGAALPKDLENLEKRI
ncbi:MAG: V-type ATP synthase subunit B [Synergistaceae bacterium]|jgi:V/A-type H+-transporting ATPase subunit B|nr:V-type ATP synthase subunit B [Synergistaceae bacterium]